MCEIADWPATVAGLSALLHSTLLQSIIVCCVAHKIWCHRCRALLHSATLNFTQIYHTWLHYTFRTNLAPLLPSSAMYNLLHSISLNCTTLVTLLHHYCRALCSATLWYFDTQFHHTFHHTLLHHTHCKIWRHCCRALCSAPLWYILIHSALNFTQINHTLLHHSL